MNSKDGHGRTRAEGIASTIEHSILSHELSVGDLIGSEEALANHFGASRPVIREAFRLLEMSGVARTRRGPGGGLIVVEPNPDPVVAAAERFLVYGGVKPAHIADARLAIELACLDSLLTTIDEDKIDRIRRFIDAEGEIVQQATEDRREFESFHTLLADLSGNKAFSLFVPVLARLSTDSTHSDMTVFRTQHQSEIHRAHTAIAEAVVMGDLAVARHRMRRHLGALANVYLDDPLLDGPHVGGEGPEQDSVVAQQAPGMR